MCRYLLTLALLCQASRVFSDTNYRLNTPIKPKAYSIAITPYFETNDDNAFTFDGEVDITLTTENQTRQIKLHSEELQFNSTNIQVFSGSNVLQLNMTNPLQFDTKYTFAFINLQNSLQVGIEYSLKISYRGPIRKDLHGFYRGYYIERGVKKWFGATQMEATHARKVFPCFDEPELKATFSLSIDRPQNYKPSVSNTKLQTVIQLNNGYIREVFNPTPVMSTYLVAFLVSEFDKIERVNGSKEIGIYTRPEALNQTDYALNFAAKVVDALGEFFGIDYYSTDANLKLKHIALPDFGAGAMENWGMLNYRESLLLYVPEVSTPYYKYRVAQIVAHETTHMWFGNLVTCHWWSNTWLNEGFANYFQNYITATVDPDVASANVLVTGSVYDAYNADSSPSSPPISNDNVNSPDEISDHFGTITYQKAGSVIRMMHHLIGDEAFRLGLKHYLETNKFTSGYPEKMYSALDIGIQINNSLAMYPNTDITEVMSSWISQAGYPVLHVDINYTTDKVVLTQKRFYQNSSYSSNETYTIPITYTTGVNPSFVDTKPVMLMKNKTHEFSIKGIHEDRRWVIFNIQETGLYRVNYDGETWKAVGRALKGSDREKIHHLNRAKIVNDLFAFLFADEVKFNLLQDVLEFMSAEIDYSVWYAAISGLKNLRNRYLGNEALADIDAYALKLLGSGIENLGYSVGHNDTFETLTNRMQILSLACKLGHEGCINHAVKLYRGLKENATEITPSLRPAVYCTGLRLGNGDDYDFLWNRMATTNVASEANVISDVLGCTSDEEKLKSYLVSMEEKDSPIRTHDLTAPIKSILSDYAHTNLVLSELKRNYTHWFKIYTTSMDGVLSLVASSLHTEAEFVDFEHFLASCSECGDEAKVEARKSLAQARALTSWAASHKEDILNALRSYGATLTPSMMLVVVLAVALESLVFC